jgi:hypothetical protein
MRLKIPKGESKSEPRKLAFMDLCDLLKLMLTLDIVHGNVPLAANIFLILSSFITYNRVCN